MLRDDVDPHASGQAIVTENSITMSQSGLVRPPVIVVEIPPIPAVVTAKKGFQIEVHGNHPRSGDNSAERKARGYYAVAHSVDFVDVPW